MSNFVNKHKYGLGLILFGTASLAIYKFSQNKNKIDRTGLSESQIFLLDKIENFQQISHYDIKNGVLEIKYLIALVDIIAKHRNYLVSNKIETIKNNRRAALDNSDMDAFGDCLYQIEDL